MTLPTQEKYEPYHKHFHKFQRQKYLSPEYIPAPAHEKGTVHERNSFRHCPFSFIYSRRGKYFTLLPPVPSLLYTSRLFSSLLTASLSFLR